MKIAECCLDEPAKTDYILITATKPLRLLEDGELGGGRAFASSALRLSTFAETTTFFGRVSRLRLREARCAFGPPRLVVAGFAVCASPVMFKNVPCVPDVGPM